MLIYILTQIASRNRTWVEVHYAQNIYPFMAKIISAFSNIFSFSLDDLFYLMLIIFTISSLVLLLLKKLRFSNFAGIILNVLATVYALFYLLWGFNYFREDINTRLSINDQTSDRVIFITVVEKIIDNTNQLCSEIDTVNFVKTDSFIESSYRLCSPALKIDYPAGKRKDKKITFSGFFAKAGISGYYGPFFNEIHVNTKILPVEYPFVLAHEKAHQFGITSEAEANFYAWLVCSQSDSKELQYSANLQILRFLLNQAYPLEEYPELVKKIDKKVIADFRQIRENWMKMRNENVDKVATKVNDTYLKTNKIKEGIDNYKGVVKFVMDFSQDSVFQQKYNLRGI